MRPTRENLRFLQNLAGARKGKKVGDWGDSPYSLLRSSPYHVVPRSKPRSFTMYVIEFKDMFIVQHGFIKSL